MAAKGGTLTRNTRRSHSYFQGFLCLETQCGHVFTGIFVFYGGESHLPDVKNYTIHFIMIVSFREKCYNTHQRTPFGGKVE